MRYRCNRRKLMQTLISNSLFNETISKTFYDERYSSGYMEVWDATKVERILEILRKMGLPQHGSTLDFGCGNGVLTKVLLQALPAWKIVGTDISETAISNASARVPGCSFLNLHELAECGQKFDLIFSHHVWEHVFDLDSVWNQMISYAKPNCRMFHILPCGNSGSLEMRICNLRKDGINHEMGNRLFFEEETHIRRLDSNQLIEKAKQSGFKPFGEYYAHQYYGAIEWITIHGAEEWISYGRSPFILSFYDPNLAKTHWCRLKLFYFTQKLNAIAYLRHLAVRFKRSNNHSFRTFVKGLVTSPLLVFALGVDKYYSTKASSEWGKCKTRRNGSEMFLCMSRDLDLLPHQSPGRTSERIRFSGNYLREPAQL
jgi:SAM-dependent methyltransferase